MRGNGATGDAAPDHQRVDHVHQAPPSFERQDESEKRGAQEFNTIPSLRHLTPPR
jgi:hypothetical protein